MDESREQTPDHPGRGIRAAGTAALIAIGLWSTWLSAGTAHGATSTTVTYRGGGWVLTLTTRHTIYDAIQGTLSVGHRRYHVEGDWIPAADAGGDLLRFFGHPFPGNSFVGLVSVATLYNTCNPYCAASTTYALTALANWTLPGSKLRSIHLVAHFR